MSDTQSAKDQIREWVQETAQRKGIGAVTDDESLTTNGVIDSLAIFRLVSFLEDTFGVRIADEEIVNDNFQSINDIDRLVASKIAPKV
ncbi:MAG TPA: acyl carrier protein [Terriglobia bacterium]